MAEMDPLVLCPFDNSHQIRLSRKQFHIVRCKKNHQLTDKEICPYNATHIVDKINFQDHLATCMDAREIQSFLYKTDDTQLTGIIPIEQINQVNPTTGEEDWDNDVYHQTYDPMKNCEDKPLVRTLIGASKAKRREFRMKERERMAKLVEEKVPKPVEVESFKQKFNEPLRPPKNTDVDEGKPRPLRPPKNWPSSSENNRNGNAILGNDLQPEDSPKCATPAEKKDSKTSEKVRMPTRKPNLETEMSKLHISSYDGALSDGPRDSSTANGDDYLTHESNENVLKRLMELEDMAKALEEERKKLTEQMRVPREGQNSSADSEQPKKVGRCAATFK
ncbi:uncharacterized protein [Fopius arisanus]|uniref:GTSF1_2 protein n=1 Tax=Fopius arisanus TaxID=64838 RepID=A0A0C9R1F5_9HYME|nr:PREDICTED: uncharacterized protein LOC105268083 [Fopius arisanus]